MFYLNIMNFNTEEWSINKLITIYEAGNLNLNPVYQRGDIWTLPAKKKLIYSIKLKYPLPGFFLYNIGGEKYEMVDGQQRTRTILGYSKGLFPDLNKEKIDATDKQFFFEDYKISICNITKASANEIEDFYYRVNKFGTKLNRPEILKAQYANTVLQNLVEKISEYPEFESLQLFTDKSLNRLNDLDFIAEIITSLKFGITERKFTVDKFYSDKEFNNKEASKLEDQFHAILEILNNFNNIFPIKNTRYRQRSDFYTLFYFINHNMELGTPILDYFYKILVLIDDGITPSNDKCFALQEYANNCVSLSHTKKARDERSKFFDELLLNKDKEPIKNEQNLTLIDVMNYYQQQDSDLVNIGDFFLLDINKLQIVTSRKYF
jgi:hypothetical protein